MRLGATENVPYSLSRWTDVVAGKWPWFIERLDEGSFLAFDPALNLPHEWSLEPEDIEGLVFWTKDPSNLLSSTHMTLQDLKRRDRIQVVMTITGWREQEQGVPSTRYACELLETLIEEYGPKQVRWRFSPIPQLPLTEVVDRFITIAEWAEPLDAVDVSFLQPNNELSETRSEEERLTLLKALGDAVPGLRVQLCKDDPLLRGKETSKVKYEACVLPNQFGRACAQESCSCPRMVDPFTLGEGCCFSCTYCYVSDKTLKLNRHGKLNTTKSLVRKKA